MEETALNRRAALLLGAALASATPAAAQTGAALPSLDTDSLARNPRAGAAVAWPGKAPGDQGTARTHAVTERSPEPSRYHDRADTGITMPDLMVYRPAQPNGAALLIMPGGGYTHITTDKEGADIAREFNKAGITGFVLRYRLPPEGWDNSMDVPHQDAQRAIRLIRARAASFGVDPRRVGVMGFSAGGHMSSTMATRWDAVTYAPVDAVDSQDTRPDFAGLIYAGVMMGGRNIEPNPSEALIQARAPLYHVRENTPPCFLAQNVDDPGVPVGNLVLFFEALRKQKVPAALHLFEKGRPRLRHSQRGGHTDERLAAPVRGMGPRPRLLGVIATRMRALAVQRGGHTAPAGNGAHQGLEVIAAFGLHRRLITVFLQAFLHHRPDRGDGGAVQPLFQFGVQSGFAGDPHQPLDLQRGGEGDHRDAPRRQFADEAGHQSGLGLRGISVRCHREQLGAAAAQGADHLFGPAAGIKLRPDAAAGKIAIAKGFQHAFGGGDRRGDVGRPGRSRATRASAWAPLTVRRMRFSAAMKLSRRSSAISSRWRSPSPVSRISSSKLPRMAASIRRWPLPHRAAAGS